MARHTAQPRRGSSATSTVLSLSVLTGFAAISIDVGMAVTGRGQLQNAYDAAALGAVADLDGTAAGVTAARASAIRLAQLHSVLGSAVTLPTNAVRFGRVDENGWVEVIDTNANAKDVNAIRLIGSQGSITAAFSRIFGVNALQVGATASATRQAGQPAGAVDCYIPLGVPQCMFDNKDSYDGFAMRLNGSNVDNVGWVYAGGPASASNVRDQLQGQCNSPVSIGDSVNLNNGQIANAVSTVVGLIEDSGDTWNSAEYGNYPTKCWTGNGASAVNGNAIAAQKVHEGPVLIFQKAGDPNGGCSSGFQFNQSAEVTGFAWMTIYNVGGGNGANATLCARLDLKIPREIGTAGGGQEGSNILAPGPVVLLNE